MRRLLRRDRGFHALIVVLLGFGIGAATLVFSVVNEVLLKPLPVRDPDNLFLLAKYSSGDLRPNEYFAEKHLREVVSKSPLVAAAVAEQIADPRCIVPMRQGESTRLLMAQIVSPNYFRELGVRPLLGRVLEDADATAGGVLPAVLSYHFWQSQYAGDTSVLGRTIRLKDFPFTIVGVLPREFHSSDADRAPEVRLPMSAGPALFGSDPQGVSLRLLVRLAPGVGSGQAATGLLPAMRETDEAVELERNARSKTPDPPELIHKDAQRWTLLAQPIARGISKMRDQFGRSLWLLLAGVILLLCAVCASVSGLLIAKSGERRREMGIRLAIGAGRWQIMRQLLAECLLLVIGGAALGGAVQWLLATRITMLIPPVRDLAQYATPQLLAVKPDLRVLAFASAVTLFAVLASGLVPAWRASRSDLVSDLKSGKGQGRSRHSGIVTVALQVAFSVVLLSAAGLMFRTWWKLDHLDPGFDRERLISFTIDPASAGYNMERTGAVASELRRRVSVLPGVKSTAWAWRGLMRGSGIKMTVAPQGVVLPPTTFLNTSLNEVTPGYFETLGLRLLAGRDVRLSDAGAAAPTPVVVNQAFAAQILPGENPVGKLLVQGTDGTKAPSRIVVGVVTTAKYRSMREPDPATMYALFNESKGSDWQLHLYVRTWGAPGDIAGAVRQTLRALDPGVPLSEVATLDDEVRASLWQERLVAILAVFFGVASVALAAIGLYGALALSVARRRREMGIRVAVGAQWRHIVRAVCSPMAAGVGAGIAAGLLAGFWLMRLTRSLLFGVEPLDPASVAAAVSIIVVCSAAAAAIPARRAMKVDPGSALREQ
jgi:predicted permease